MTSKRLEQCAASAPWSIGALLRDLAARGRHPAVVSFVGDGPDIWESATLAGDALRLAAGLRQDGGGAGVRVALYAPNSPEWIVAALAILAAGRVLVPIDDLAAAEALDAALSSSGARTIFTTAGHLDAGADLLGARGIRALLLSGPERAGAPGWRSLCRPSREALPAPAADDPAVLTWTSGTTGAPKAFLLSHRNIAVNVAALCDLAIVGPADRALLPLPLHHAYPLVVGMLATLTAGAALVLPDGTSGPALLRALREGDATAIVGVPRLYEALLAAIEARLAARGPVVRLAWRAVEGAAIRVERASGWCPGRLLFAPVRRRLGPRLRLLVSGGARLDRAAEERLAALGWTVLSGYGLAETASLFCGNRPGARRVGSAGRPLAGGEVRIAEPDEAGIGEITLRGPSIIRGYLDNPEADRAAFTPDGWFRTGDLGQLDRDGFLFVTGRVKEILVLGGGKKVIPEELERIYGGAPEIGEIALLEENGALVALVRPDLARLRERGAADPRDAVRVVLMEKAQGLPSHQRLAGVALTDRPLPRTRLGKYRRFLLPALYAEARAGGARRAARPLSAEDAALLADPSAAAIWALLRQRYPDRAVDLDVDLSLDLNLDSFAWMELTVSLEERFGVHLAEADIAQAETIRDLLRAAIAQRRGVPPEEPAIAADIARWLTPPGAGLRLLGALLYGVNRLAMRGLFRLRSTGIENLPAAGAFVLTPNHASYLDAPAIAAALPWSRCRRLYWAGDARLLFSSRLSRLLCRVAQVVPVDARHPEALIETAARVIAAGNALVWFPEGWRTPDGRLQRFLPGVGELLRRARAPAVPAYVDGSFAALPRHRRLPRPRRITVSFGRAEPVAALSAAGSGSSEAERIADGLRRRVAALAAAAASQERPDSDCAV